MRWSCFEAQRQASRHEKDFVAGRRDRLIQPALLIAE
jgi:hypothetical protein